MITMNLKRVFLGVLTAAVLLVPATGWAADENDVVNLEKQLIQKETALLEPEMKLDTLIIERAKLDGVGGWFQGSKKKEIERQMAEQQALIDQISREMASLQKQVQEKVYEVAQTYEGKGEFKKAIEYYLKIERQDDRIRYRIAFCFKSLKDYESAIQWILKMARTDANSLEIVDCYKLDGRMKEAIYWLFQILEPIDGNPAELTALDLIEKYTYPGLPNDYPDFARRLSDVYIAKAVYNYKSDFGQARADYQKAISLIAGSEDPKAVSMKVLDRYHNAYMGAVDILDQQKEAAERYYENMLREAKQNYDDAEYRFRRAQREAEDEYRRAVDFARQEVMRAERELKQAESAASPSAQLIEQARRRVKEARDREMYLMHNHQRFIDDYVRPARREMDQAMDHYNDVVASRTRIIEDYIAPYKAKVEAARRAYEMMRSLHEAVFN